jgi:hypothetical protein
MVWGCIFSLLLLIISRLYRLINLSKIPKHGDLLPFKPKISIKTELG